MYTLCYQVKDWAEDLENLLVINDVNDSETDVG